MKEIIIDKNNSGERVDKFLMREVFFTPTPKNKELLSVETISDSLVWGLNSKITRGEIIRQIKDGNVLVGGKKIKPSYILKIGDKLEINISEKNTQLKPNKNVKFEIIYQDKNIIAVNKPAGLQVHPVKSLRDHGASPEQTLANGLLYKFPEVKNVGDDPENRPGIVHRLDKDTSGIMIIARNQENFLELKNKFKNREIIKKYQAIVYGKLKNKSGVIEKPIARAGNYKKQTIANAKTKTKIRPAVTEYKVLKEFKDYSLVEASPKTGRTHQIRIHLFSIGHPIVGDEKYKSRTLQLNVRPSCNNLFFNSSSLQTMECFVKVRDKLKNIPVDKNVARHLLHAKSIEFELGGKKYNFETELPEDFCAFLDEKRKKG